MMPLVRAMPVLLVAMLSLGVTRGEKQAVASPLEGAWVAQEMVSRGQAAPAEVVANVKFTFKGDKVAIAGNRGDQSEDVCPFTIDASTSPRHIDIVNPNGATMQGIYEIKDGVLKLALGPARPADFQPGPGVIVMTLKKATQ